MNKVSALNLSEGGNQQTGAAAISALCLCTMLGSLAVSSGNIALPTLATAFQCSFSMVQWVVVAYLLASTGVIVSAGKLGDIAGRRNVLIAGIGVFAVASALGGLASSLGVLIAARTMQGAGAAAMIALSLAIAAERAPAGGSGKWMGLIASMSAVGTALGPSLGGMLIQLAGWQAIFLFNVPIALAAAAIAQRFLPKDRRQPSNAGQFDWRGALLLGLALVALSVGSTERNRPLVMTGALALCGLATAMFIRVERTTPVPLVPSAILTNRPLASGIALSAAVSAAVMTAMVIGPFYLSQALSLAPAEIGMVMATGPILVAVSAPGAGRLADHVGSARMTFASVAAACIGCLMLAIQRPQFGVGGFVAGFVVLTLAYSGFQTANNGRVMALAPTDMRGVASGLLSLSRNLGLLIGAAVMSALFAAAGGATHVPGSANGAHGYGMLAAFGLCSMIMAGALVVACTANGKPAWRAPPRDTPSK